MPIFFFLIYNNAGTVFGLFATGQSDEKKLYLYDKNKQMFKKLLDFNAQAAAKLFTIEPTADGSGLIASSNGRIFYWSTTNGAVFGVVSGSDEWAVCVRQSQNACDRRSLEQCAQDTPHFQRR